MLAAVDAPKSKTISIGFFSFKIMLLGFFFVKQVKQTQTTQCTSENGSLLLSYMIFFLGGVFFDIFFVLYFYLTSRFSQLQYYVFYVMHLIFAIFSIIITLAQLDNNGFCSGKQQFIGTCLFINIIFLAVSLVLMWSNLYFGLKFVHMGSNTIWAFIWFTQSQNTETIPLIISIIHCVLSFTNLLSLNIANCMKKKKSTANLWRLMYIFSIFFMVICYILSYISEMNRASIFLQTYHTLGWVEIIPPLLLLFFLNTQFGDIRDNMIKKDANVFPRSRENQDFYIDDSN